MALCFQFPMKTCFVIFMPAKKFHKQKLNKSTCFQNEPFIYIKSRHLHQNDALFITLKSIACQTSIAGNCMTCHKSCILLIKQPGGISRDFIKVSTCRVSFPWYFCLFGNYKQTHEFVLATLPGFIKKHIILYRLMSFMFIFN